MDASLRFGKVCCFCARILASIGLPFDSCQAHVTISVQSQPPYAGWGAEGHGLRRRWRGVKPKAQSDAKPSRASLPCNLHSGSSGTGGFFLWLPSAVLNASPRLAKTPL
eukprot:4983224-Amphidinium_carterae.2